MLAELRRSPNPAVSVFGVPPALTDAELNALLDQFPVLTGRRRRLEDLPGGLTNRNVKVSTEDGNYVARCADPENLLGIDREAEYHNSRAAEAAGVGAPVVGYRPDLGILLVGFLDGVTLTNDDFGRPGVIARVAAGCRALHHGPRFHGDFDMFALQPQYLRVVLDNGFRLPAGYLDFAESFGRIQQVLAAGGMASVPCHNDLLAANFIEDGDRVWLIDYEYSGNNDPFFEVGNLWSEASGDVDQLERLVTAYVGEPSPALTSRAWLWGLMSKYGWTLWAAIQDGASELDFDFWDWGMEKYHRAVAEFNGPDFGRRLEEVRNPY